MYTLDGQEVHFIKPEFSPPFSQKPATESCRGQSNLVHTRTLTSLSAILTLSSRLRHGFHSGFTLRVL